ncbi:hypothetical protein RRG08_036753 [Elysia crispata]|uniref:Uncharacterized protein n=1 Tax=Elysia crispata TaxID=231223 RepID=A0AAE0ZGK4_9GAST|nr:hypothetical protein RRG08_036753 [Elysia crispata]
MPLSTVKRIVQESATKRLLLKFRIALAHFASPSTACVLVNLVIVFTPGKSIYSIIVELGTLWYITLSSIPTHARAFVESGDSGQEKALRESKTRVRYCHLMQRSNAISNYGLSKIRTSKRLNRVLSGYN